MARRDVVHGVVLSGTRGTIDAPLFHGGSDQHFASGRSEAPEFHEVLRGRARASCDLTFITVVEAGLFDHHCLPVHFELFGD